MAALIPATRSCSFSPVGVSLPFFLEAGAGRCSVGDAGAFTLTGPCVSSSQSDIGFGKLETYVKLDKLGEVRGWVWSSQGSQAGGLGGGTGSSPASLICPLTGPAPQRRMILAWQLGPALAGVEVGPGPAGGHKERVACGLWAGSSWFFWCVFFFSCKYFLSGFESQLYHLLSLWPWVCFVTSLCLCFFLCQVEIVSVLPHRLV